ncbi:SAV_915 family protein [Streptomyces sp. GMY02]|uniref:SAV_915 family protein n=1 Tax=Streptomyces sp. GMY02 TaxID=1333528 RepID=UPI0020B66ED5|nr:SAV_915 family protein [Streptomyces sp. GMY02]
MERLIPEDADSEPADPAAATDDAVPDDSDPSDPDPDGSRPDDCRAVRPLYVPVRLGSCGGYQLRFARTPLGARTAIGFTSPHRLTAVLGERQAWIRLAEPALRALAAPLGTTIVTVDPQLTAPAPVSAIGRQATPVRACARHAPPVPEPADAPVQPKPVEPKLVRPELVRQEAMPV